MTRAYVDRPITDHLAADRVAGLAADHWRLRPPKPMRYGMNAVYLSGDVVLRVATPNAPGAALLDLVSTLGKFGVPTPLPVREDALTIDGHAVTAWERIEPTDLPVDWRSVGSIVGIIHRLAPSELPRRFPLADPAELPWWRFDALLRSGVVDPPALAGLRHVVDRHAHWLRPETWADAGEVPVVCHGDIVPPNITMTADGPLLVDFDLLCLAPRGWDHGPLLTWVPRWGGEERAYELFADGYGRSLRDDPATVAFGELRLVAATLLRVQAAARDSAAGDELERRLRYWRGDPHPPGWQLA